MNYLDGLTRSEAIEFVNSLDIDGKERAELMAEAMKKPVSRRALSVDDAIALSKAKEDFREKRTLAILEFLEKNGEATRKEIMEAVKISDQLFYEIMRREENVRIKKELRKESKLKMYYSVIK